MDRKILSANAVLDVLKQKAELKELLDKGLQVFYPDIWPGVLTIEEEDDKHQVHNVLVPVWQININHKELERIGCGSDDCNDQLLYVNFKGDFVHVRAIDFTMLTVGTVLRYPDGTSLMLEKCERMNHKYFIPEPKNAIGLKKDPILDVWE